jgi:hypothetical protein
MPSVELCKIGGGGGGGGVGVCVFRPNVEIHI